MNFRTDLALEVRESLAQADTRGILSSERQVDDVRISTISVLNESGARAIQKPVGKYLTLEAPGLFRPGGTLEQLRELLTDALVSMLPQRGAVLVVGLGNDAITPDALGPKAVSRVFATRHIKKELSEAVGLRGLRPVAAIAPGVLGRTGVETAEILTALTQRLQIEALLVIDALASRRLSRVGSTVQLSDSGISPGSGVGNRRAELSQSTLGVPVIALGVPTVVDADTLASDLAAPQDAPDVEDEVHHMMVTPKEIDLLIEHAAGLLADSINCALQPSLSLQELRLLTQ